MIDWFKSLFNKNDDADNAKSAEEKVRLSAVALMYEVMRADGEHKSDELEALVKKLALRWQLDANEAKTLLSSAGEQVEQAVDYHQLVSALREAYSAEQRKELIVDMWIIAKADGVIDPMEEFVIRKVADLLYVSHSDFIYGKVHGEESR
jgi:uncharacterized tellurite resistance protein B-like protein